MHHSWVLSLNSRALLYLAPSVMNSLKLETKIQIGVDHLWGSSSMVSKTLVQYQFLGWHFEPHQSPSLGLDLFCCCVLPRRYRLGDKT